MNNDLISREWLEDAFDNLCCHNCKTCRNFIIEDSFYKCDLIDKAPTVNIKPIANVTFDKDELEKIVNDRVVEPIKKGELVVKTIERPQGEWIDYSEAEGYVECPICNHLTNCDGNIDELHYCWNCGADMRGDRGGFR